MLDIETGSPEPTLPSPQSVFFVNSSQNAHSPDSPASRPESALSGGSSFVNDTDEDEESFDNNPFTPITPRAKASTRSRDRSRCILCGSQDNLEVIRLTGVENDGDSLIHWLGLLDLLSEDFPIDHLSNLMTVCELHAKAYSSYVWRIVPCEEDRMLLFDHELQQRRDRQATPSDLLSGKRTVPQLSGYFDILVFMPDQMPPLDDSPLKRVYKRRLSPPTTNISDENKTYVHPWLDPFIAFAMSLSIANAGYRPPPDPALQELEAKLRTLRETFSDYHKTSINFSSEYSRIQF